MVRFSTILNTLLVFYLPISTLICIFQLEIMSIEIDLVLQHEIAIEVLFEGVITEKFETHIHSLLRWTSTLVFAFHMIAESDYSYFESSQQPSCTMV